MKRKGFTFIDIISGMFIACVCFVSLLKVLTFSNDAIEKMKAKEYFENTLINTVEILKVELSQTGSLSSQILPPSDMGGNIYLYKDFINDTSLYVLRFSLVYNGVSFNETVVISAYE